MELELRKETYSCYDAPSPVSEKHEQSAETIIPDYCPDIGRIVESSGSLFLRSREIADTRVSVSGTLHITLLYIADGNGGLKSFSYSLPVEETLDIRVREGCSEVRLDGTVSALEIRALNPRKILTRAVIELTAAPYCATQLTVCGEIAESGENGIETLCQTQEVSLIRALREKDFVFSDEIVLSGTKEPIAELLRMNARPRVTETRLLGSKLIVKGIACTDILYLSESGTICRMTAELPFSQIIEGGGENGETASAEVFLRLTGAESRLGAEDGDGRTISVKLFLHAFAVLRECVMLRCICDLYSVSHELTAQMQTLELCAAPQLVTHEHPVREQIETGVEAASVLGTEVSFSSVELTAEGERALLRCMADLRILYLDEGGAPLAVERRVEISAQAAVPDGCRVALRDVSAGEINASASAGGIEVRFPAVFTLECTAQRRCPCLCALKSEPRKESAETAPSLILRAPLPGQRLWDLAKECRTTVSDILTANELSAETDVTVGEMLLIPRKR